MTEVWTREEIAAFMAGALSGADAERIAAALETDPAAQAAAEALADGAPAPDVDARLQTAFAAPLAEPAPAAIAAALAGSGNVTAFPAGRRAGTGGAGGAAPRWAPHWALAASVALAVGLGAGFGLRTPETPVQAAAALSVGPAEGAALAALEGAPSGAARDGLRLAASFRDGAGRACREFDTLDAAGAATGGGVACRAAPGDWRVLMLAAAPQAADAAPGFAPAGGEAADPLGAFLDALEAGPALSPDAEAELIARGWR